MNNNNWSIPTPSLTKQAATRPTIRPSGQTYLVFRTDQIRRFLQLCPPSCLARQECGESRNRRNQAGCRRLLPTALFSSVSRSIRTLVLNGTCIALQLLHWEGNLKRPIQTTLCVVAIALISLSAFAQQPSAQPGAAIQPAASTPAPVQPMLSHVNRHLPAWLRFSGEYRMRVEGFDGGGFKPDTRDAYALNRVRLNMRVAPTYWMRFQFQAQDAQAFGKNAKPDAPPFEDTMDIRQAYVEFGKARSSVVPASRRTPGAGFRRTAIDRSSQLDQHREVFRCGSPDAAAQQIQGRSICGLRSQPRGGHGQQEFRRKRHSRSLRFNHEGRAQRDD